MSWDPVSWIARLANGYKHWLADLNRESFNSVTTQVVWLYGSIILTNVAAQLMLDEGPKSESHHAWGFQVITALLIAWGVKTGANVVESRQKQRSNAPFVEAQERGKVAGAALAASITERVRQVQTGEHAALPAIQVEAKDQATVKVETVPPVPPIEEAEEHQWRDRKPDEGLG